MFEINSLIGETLDFACKILKENGYNDIEIKINSVLNANENTKLVCNVHKHENKIELICGEFILEV